MQYKIDCVRTIVRAGVVWRLDNGPQDRFCRSPDDRHRIPRAAVQWRIGSEWIGQRDILVLRRLVRRVAAGKRHKQDDKRQQWIFRYHVLLGGARFDRLESVAMDRGRGRREYPDSSVSSQFRSVRKQGVWGIQLCIRSFRGSCRILVLRFSE